MIPGASEAVAEHELKLRLVSLGMANHTPKLVHIVFIQSVGSPLQVGAVDGGARAKLLSTPAPDC